MSAARVEPEEIIDSCFSNEVFAEGVSGYYFGGGSHGDQEGFSVVDQQMIRGRIRGLLVGQDPLDAEMIWQWLWVANFPENVASVIDNALLGPRGPPSTRRPTS